MSVAKMINMHPNVDGHLNEPLATAIRHIMYAAPITASCADACLAEDAVADMRQCIRLCLDTSDICAMAVTVATRRTGENVAVLRQALELVVSACRTCDDECARHDMDHCRQCATMCREVVDDATKAIAEL